MRLHSSLVSFLFVCASVGAIARTSVAPTCADLHLVPAVRECTAVKSVAIGSAGVRVIADKNAEDEFAAKDLEESLKARGITVGKANAATIRLHRVISDHAKEGFEEYKIAPTAARGLSVTAQTDAGIFYGAQTVKQLIRGLGKDAVLLVPTIRDWPAMAHRGLSDDWSRGPLPNMEFLKREIRTLAAYKYNIFLALLRAHVCLCEHAGCGVSRVARSLPMRLASLWRMRRSITSRSFRSRRRSGICIMC